jgi:hypothetical protein
MSFSVRDLASPVFQAPASPCGGNTVTGNGEEKPCENSRQERRTAFGEHALDALRRQLRARLS